MQMCVMDITHQIHEIEAQLAERGESVNAFCDRVGINRATWQRWKAGVTLPNWRNWHKVLEVNE